MGYFSIHEVEAINLFYSHSRNNNNEKRKEWSSDRNNSATKNINNNIQN